MRRRKTAVLLVLTALLAAGFLLWGNCSCKIGRFTLEDPPERTEACATN